MKREKMIILPRLHTCNGDLSKQWVIFYSVRNPKTAKMERFKVSEGINKHKTIESRTNVGNLICAQYAEKLKHVWSPYVDDSRIIYEDHLEYDKISRIYGKKRADNKSIRYYANKYLETLIGKIDKVGTMPTYCLFQSKSIPVVQSKRIPF